MENTKTTRRSTKKRITLMISGEIVDKLYQIGEKFSLESLSTIISYVTINYHREVIKKDENSPNCPSS